MNHLLIIGGSGYIGSRLREVLSSFYTVDSLDCGWFTSDDTSKQMDYRDLTPQELEKYSAIILLAGHSSVATCNGPIQGPWLNNVSNFTALIDKISKDTCLIYASSASVYGNSLPGQYHREDQKQFVPVNNYDITKYTLDLEAQLAITRGYNIIGLRFGTVNGWSPVLRTDVMINAMYTSAVIQGKIFVTNKHVNRALLGIEDLCRGMQRCLTTPNPGIYNMASFNTTVERIADDVATKLNVPVVDNGHTPNVYDFGLDASLFQQTFDFTFAETPASIVDSLVKKYHLAQTGRRDDYIEYQ